MSLGGKTRRTRPRTSSVQRHLSGDRLPFYGSFTREVPSLAAGIPPGELIVNLATLSKDWQDMLIARTQQCIRT